MNDKKIIPIFYACDDAFVKYTIVSIKSMMENASKDFFYRIHILIAGVSDDMRQKTLSLQDDNFEIRFEDVTSYLTEIKHKLPIRDYYSKTTYFRLFIADMFKEYDKALYIDSDTVVLGDISELYNTDLSDNYAAACPEQAMIQVNEYGTYVEKVIGIERHAFFNAGILLLNCKKYREEDMLKKFTDLLATYTFIVTQDEDYLNLMFKDKVLLLNPCWNTEVFGQLPCEEKDIKILHYIMVSKPWHYTDCRLKEYFWNYAKKTPVYDDICQVLNTYTDEQRHNDAVSCDRLLQTAIDETNREDNYLNMLRNKQAADRVEVLKKIEELEAEGRFDVDVEDDPPTKPLPDDIDYTREKITSKIKTNLAFKAARKFVSGLIDNKQLIVKDIIGLENLLNLKGGAIVTCNHFNAFDSFTMQMVFDHVADRGQLFRVIREGNYTSFPGFYGFLMKNCNTLPLGETYKSMTNLMKAVSTLLERGDYILVYPEQSMWWNYRKPKPLKKGAYSMASNNNVPVLPCFITMRDSGIMGEDGFFVQEYTVHIGKPIYPQEGLSKGSNAEYMKEENFKVWKEIYESTYNIPLVYTTRDHNRPMNAV